MKIAFCASEIFPLAKTGGLADVAGALPIALSELGIEVALFMPRYQSLEGDIQSAGISGLNLSKTTIGRNLNVYLIEHRSFSSRAGLYGNEKGDYKDNFKRFGYYSYQTLNVLEKIGFQPDIIHCHDWHTALIPVILKRLFRQKKFYTHIKTLFTIHNLAYQGLFEQAQDVNAQVKKKFFDNHEFEFYHKVNFLKAAIINSDYISTVSPAYAKEILRYEYGCGLEGVLYNRKDHLTGILNGIDYQVWNPKTDTMISVPYSAKDVLEKKTVNKEFLQREVKLPLNKKVPLFGFVGRISHQKGIDLILESFPELLKLNAQWVIQGIGNEHYYKPLKEWAKKYPDKVAVRLAFDEHLAHEIYAGADMLLMPSNYEPCGLSQMISMRYGTVPVVFKTGGLADTVIDIQHNSSKANGFMFSSYNKKDF
ncbi:MAG: glycogen synthase, partial [Candidatus Omnitrophica bacterium]|nr:glycogen synthase [Candidatus Omnitrophota bacterium]